MVLDALIHHETSFQVQTIFLKGQITESENNVGGKAPFDSKLLVKSGSTMLSDQAAQGFIQTDVKNLQVWSLHNFSSQQIQKSNPVNYIPERGITRQENCSITKWCQHDKIHIAYSDPREKS